jgi:hypothetical protein
MKSLYLVLLSFFIITVSFGQSQGIAYTAVGKGVATTFVTDYHALGINTSALGWKPEYGEKKFTLGTTEFGFGIYSDSMNVDRLKKLYKAIRTQVSGAEGETADWQEQQQYAAEYLNRGISMFVDYNWGGFAYQNEKFGGIAFNVRESYQWYSRLNEDLTDILFKGKMSSYFDSLTVVFGADTSVIANNPNLSSDTLDAVILGTVSTPLNISQITKGSEIRSVWNRYYSFGYGRKIFGRDSLFVVYAGVGGRFIQSMAMFNLESNDDGFSMYTSMSPNFNIDYGAVAASNPSNYIKEGKFLPSAVGNGYGVDLSASVIIFNSLKIAASVNNIGQVTYNRNVYRMKDTLVFDLALDGLSDYNVTQSANQFLRDGTIFELEGQEQYVLKNAANFRFGASLDLGKIARFGFDMVAPFDRTNPGGLVNPIFSFGGEVRPVKWIALSAGYFGGGIYRNNIPVGINFIIKDGAYEFGVSSYDALTFFTQNSNSVSAAFGFARMRF